MRVIWRLMMLFVLVVVLVHVVPIEATRVFGPAYSQEVTKITTAWKNIGGHGPIPKCAQIPHGLRMTGVPGDAPWVVDARNSVRERWASHDFGHSQAALELSGEFVAREG